MNSRKIINIVFYKYFDSEGEKKQACIFYEDGAKLVSFEDGIKACEEIVKAKKITSIEDFRKLINKDMIHIVSGDEFINNFNYYATHSTIDFDKINEEIEENINEVEATEKNDLLDSINAEKETKEAEEVEEPTTEDEEELDKNESYDYTDDTEIMAAVEPEESEEPKEEKGLFGFFKKQIRKIKESKLVKGIVAVVTTLAIGLGLYSCAARKTAEGKMYNSNLSNHTRKIDLDDLFGKEAKTTANTNEATSTINYNGGVITNNNSDYNNYTYAQLQEVTTNQTQKRAMKNVYDTLYKFNGEFANAYVEEGKDVKPALTFEEVVALQQAYNNYSKEEIMAIFNGAEVNASDMSRAYRDASLQLMGAYVIENSQNPVDMSMLIESEEGKEFYQRYHQMFLAAKEATGNDRLIKINEFFSAVRKDFPVTNEVRTEGIAHADTYRSVMEGKGGAGPAVAPMIAAAEMIFQNDKVNYTLNDSEIDFINDIGLCNYVDKKFERIEIISLGMCHSDETNPTYEQYRNAIIKELKANKMYVIDDAHRELTKLDSFQNTVNWHFAVDGDWKYSGGFYEETSSYTETKTWSETTTTYREEETRTRKSIPQSEKEKIDAEIEKENNKAKTEAEAKAEETRREMQEKEDQKKAEIDKEVAEDAKDLEEKIDDANEQIDKNHDDDPTNDKPVNEKDLGHGVDFDDEHSDENGNLDDSVENITTDPTGDQTGQDLPDPNETGAKFDAKVVPEPEINYEESTVQNREEVETTYEETTYETQEPAEPSYEESTYVETPVVIYDEVVLDDGSGYYEEIVDEYIETLANDSENTQEEAYEYQK